MIRARFILDRVHDFGAGLMILFIFIIVKFGGWGRKFRKAAAA